jgi:hypothetical protein
MALTNAEKQAQWRARRDQHIKSLEKEVKQLKAGIEKLQEAPEGAQHKQTRRRIQLNWEILVDDDGDGFVSADIEPYELYVSQLGKFWWYVLKREDYEDAVDVAEGDAPSLVAAMAAAEAAVRGLAAEERSSRKSKGK